MLMSNHKPGGNWSKTRALELEEEDGVKGGFGAHPGGGWPAPEEPVDEASVDRQKEADNPAYERIEPAYRLLPQAG